MAYGRPGVYVNETLLPAPIVAVGGANAAGAAIGCFAQGPTTLTLVRSWYEFAKNFGGYNNKYPATIGIAQFFNNGGTELYVQRVLGSGAAQASVTLPATAGSLATVKALNKGTDGNNLRVQVTTGATVNGATTYNLTVYKEIVTQYLGTNNSNGANDAVVEVFSNLVFNDVTASNFAETVVNNSSANIVLSLTDTTKTPATQLISAVLPLTGGTDGAAVTTSDYAGYLGTDGSSPFDGVDRPLVIFAPEIYNYYYITRIAAGDSAATAANTATTNTVSIQNSLVTWAASGNGFAVLDTPPSLDVNGAKTYTSGSITTASAQAAMYYPNYYIADPLSGSNNALRKIGPASAVAGLYITTDKQVGPFKSPAGTNASLRGAISLERTFTPTDLDSLNTATVPVNAIRNIPGAGVVVMGGRTLLQDGTANKYVNMRRSLIYIKKRLKDLTQFAVFQNNDYRLWEQLNTVVTVFLNEYRNQGGLRGATPAQSFYVKVDSENNTPTSIALGEVRIEVGVALEYPAEFVVINLSQTTGA